MVPLQRPDEMHAISPTSHSWTQTTSGYEDMCTEHRIPTMITWSHGGKEIAVEGSWDNWKSRFHFSFFIFFFIHSLHLLFFFIF